MFWLHHLAWFAGGLILANAMPHLASGVTGRAFQTPFAKPPGNGLSSSMVNVLWGFANLLAAWWLVERVGDFDPRSAADAGVFGLGMLMALVGLAWSFDRLHRGSAPTEPSDPP
jgi:hypothetical protein